MLHVKVLRAVELSGEIGHAGSRSNLFVTSTFSVPLEISVTSVVWSYETFDIIFGINHRFVKYLKRSCALDSGQHFSFKYFLRIAFV